MGTINIFILSVLEHWILGNEGERVDLDNLLMIAPNRRLQLLCHQIKKRTGMIK